jgi:two-component sensor histidine kinase
MTSIHVTPRNSSQTPPRDIRREPGKQPRGAQFAELQRLRERQAALQQEIEVLTHRYRAQAAEFDHRLLNGVQMVASLLSAQSRVASPKAAAQLMMAVNRIVAFGHVHRQLHLLDHERHVEFKRYLERLTEDLAGLLFPISPADTISVQGTRCKIPTVLGIPLGFIVSELITNSAKHANGKIIVRFETPSPHSHVLSVEDDGPGLPAGFGLNDGNGLGMKIIQAFVKQVDGKLRITSGNNGRGAHFAISFHSPMTVASKVHLGNEAAG